MIGGLYGTERGVLRPCSGTAVAVIINAVIVIDVAKPAAATALVASILLTFVSQTSAAVISAASASLADITSAIASATDGDTVVVPAGTASWTSTLTITKGITLQGATTTAGAGTTSPTAADATVILDNIPRTDSATVIGITLSPNTNFRLTGFTVKYGSLKTTPTNAGSIRITGTCPGASGTGSLRVDHCHFNQLYNAAIVVNGWIYGVIDHNLVDVQGSAGAGTIESMWIYNGRTWGGGTNDYGDGSWAEPAYFGSEKFLFVETNTINNLGTNQVSGAIDIRLGSRYVNRFNCFKNCTMVNSHGTESGGRLRGQRAAEYYKNIGTTTSVQSLGLTRSGVCLYHNNNWTGPYGSSGLSQIEYRMDFPYKVFGGADGTSPWDVNDTEGNGTNVPGHSPYLYARGTAASNTTVSTVNGTFTVSGNPGWTTNRFAGCEIINTTQTTNSGQHPNSRIVSNTSNTITFVYTAPDGTKTFNTGDGFAIYRVLIALDQCGRGAGDLLSGDTPINTVTGNAAWPHQAVEPAYCWNNTMSGSSYLGSVVTIGSAYAVFKENRDYYNQTTSFDGSVGVGVGTLAQMPSTCTPGVAYWATDQGEWDSTHDGPDGQLYVCTAPDTWSFYYKPYVYPHPLVSGVLVPPTNLRVLP